MLTLYEHEDFLAALLETQESGAAPALQGELEQRIEQALAGALEKRDHVAQFLAHLETQQQMADEEIARLRARRELFARAQERLENYVMAVMERLEVKKLEGRTSVLSLRSCPASVVIETPAAIPAKFVEIREERHMDKRTIKAALEAGEAVPGARLVTDRKILVRR